MSPAHGKPAAPAQHPTLTLAQSWNSRNLFNLWRRSWDELPDAVKPAGRAQSRMTSFKNTRATMFQQRWAAKALVRGYHGDHVNEKVFKRWLLPSSLPDVRPKPAVLGDDKDKLALFARRRAVAEKEQRRLQEEEDKGMAPVGSLMFSEVERRVDVFVFRCCFAHSVYEARRLVVHGYVRLNGVKHNDPNTRLAPGDMITVDPAAVRIIQPQEGAAEHAEVDAAADAEAEPEPAPAAEAASDAPADADAAPADVDAPADAKAAPTHVPKPFVPQLTGLAGALAPRRAPTATSKSAPAALTPFHLPPFASPFLFVPAYIEVSFAACAAVYVRHPTARPGYSEIPTPYDADGEIVRLAWEWYAQCRPRMRSQRQLGMERGNRKSAEELSAE
ncbi:alpha-L RNA-binding motif-containing protein [Athelia psychrophila]|uniref:Alpha-L RNA-binding motif-containing protein n=1 Tax=Athelia psychrophila TaxID=1759441 RepID=A0A166R9T3_9AGAM|nr:alpha-L RNA-binding motif-containing protein [Fibularhizoctonia sp. CBS 109695]